MAEGVVESDGRTINQASPKSGFSNHRVEVVERIGLNGHENDLGFNAPGFEFFPIPHDFVDRERNVLLGLEFHEFVHVLSLKRRELDEANKDRLPREGIGGLLLPNLKTLGEFFDGELNLRNTRGFSRRISEDAGRSVGF
jgi:hypothetical protein